MLSDSSNGWALRCAFGQEEVHKPLTLNVCDFAIPSSKTPVEVSTHTMGHVLETGEDNLWDKLKPRLASEVIDRF